MNYKRETSTSVADLHLSQVSDSIKRLAISHDGKPAPNMLSIRNPTTVENSQNILSVMSNARDDFNARYDIIKEIGKGGFSTVYQCRNRQTGADYAVKVVDLRPLRLRERFNPARLKREVDIMRRLKHPNVIGFVEVYEDSDHLMMIMEYCPGRELFDVILAKKYLREDEARSIFAQVARALFYLHTLNIIHRDVKPENVLILNNPDPITGEPIAKLLDFGLSKNAGAGSAAKTFVGTPCYLAPEVEYTSKGLGGTYGLPADCWSLGAVLYVMLVARFPEFEQDMSGKVVVKLPPALFMNISNEAKDLIRSLMNTNPSARLTMAGALMHPWLGKYRATPTELSKLSVATSELSHDLQVEAEMYDIEDTMGDRKTGPELTAGGNVVHHQAMVVRPHEQHPGQIFTPEDLQLTPLMHLQKSIALCFEEAHAQYMEYPEVAAQVRKGAALCRQQLVESTKMLRKVEQTANEVLNMFPDLELAVEEEEPALANEFFNIVKEWVTELRSEVAATQKLNKASMSQIQKVVEQSAIDYQKSEQKKQNVSINVPVKLLESLMTRLRFADGSVSSAPAVVNGLPSTELEQLAEEGDSSKSVASTLTAESINLDANQVLELFMSLFSPQGQKLAIKNGFEPTSATIESESLSSLPPPPPVSPGRVINIDSTNSSKSSAKQLLQKEKSNPEMEQCEIFPRTPLKLDRIDEANAAHEQVLVFHSPQQLMDPTQVGNASPKGSKRLVEALHKLRQVDIILEQLNVFWANTEVVLDLLTKKGQHVEQFIGFSTKPKLMARFRERMEEYKRFWEGISLMSTNYIAGIQSDRQRMYGFLEKSGPTATPDDLKSTPAPRNPDSFDSINGGLFGDQRLGL